MLLTPKSNFGNMVGFAMDGHVLYLRTCTCVPVFVSVLIMINTDTYSNFLYRLFDFLIILPSFQMVPDLRVGHSLIAMSNKPFNR